jgi:hypothetical protein
MVGIEKVLDEKRLKVSMGFPKSFGYSRDGQGQSLTHYLIHYLINSILPNSRDPLALGRPQKHPLMRIPRLLSH